ncbi:hypothetical protein [Acetobacter sp.]|uniref:hypothetical protein n=1 Tax=Acetobacter sp. TaxID=440 RepID=UPI0025BE062C|nr:hypothetical protein [Acetobacter sp.]MCH4090112.1 hypothetical protein [Acetobacter sp.]MCI1298808.1 hypothetical protein [Acetobacter sp.]MCI1314827.1 hypothetical protein [Acetobacter sp.]
MAENSYLNINTINKVNNSIYKSDKCRFDLGSVHDKNLKIRIIQALDLGFSVRNKTPMMGKTCAFLELNIDPSLKFFDDADEFCAPSRITDRSVYGIATSGASLWQSTDCNEDAFLAKKIIDKNERNIEIEKLNVCRLSSSPLSRFNRKIWVNPTGVRVLMGDVFLYGYLVNTVWHEIHHQTTAVHHTRTEAPYGASDPWVTDMSGIIKAFPETAMDPVTGKEVPLYTFNWTSLAPSTRYG